MNCDIFCAVVDNYGDIGVCWRLARQLASEYGFAVRLLCDDLQVFARICPGLDAGAARQRLAGVEICRWDQAAAMQPAGLVLETFGCRLPETYVEAMLRSGGAAPVWINFEYLSAEKWVEGCHGLPSRHPRLPLVTWFFYPGFTAATGGLLREAALLQERRQFCADAAAIARYRAALGLELRPQGQYVSLFCYDQAPLDDWLAELAAGPAAVTVVVPESVAGAALSRWGLAPQAGARAAHGALTLLRIALQDQAGYDRLLWSCDFNVVRGEDSFLRALWADRPFCWHIYPQQDGAHAAKLDAFLARYAGDTPAAGGQPLADFMRAWNALPAAPAVVPAWQALQAARTEAAGFAAARAEHFGSMPDAASMLVKLVQEKL
ncbi:MAG: elongation factor P maturation arginine rhamnosyltransferase EarP [Rhodocyclaceae bacterium]|nr:elongation factor P maturation arginine rhamnosyltransferase EarP [Rhodocyclaceae bacterium]